jgi:hypothetical protein
MTEAALEKNYSWDQSVQNIYRKLIQNPPDTPHYQKLLLLAQLKASAASEESADAIAGYTKQLAFLTWLIAIATMTQALVAVLAYARPIH